MMAFPHLRSVPPPPPVQELQHHQPQPLFPYFVPDCGPPRNNHRNNFNNRGNGRGRGGSGWSRKPPVFNNNFYDRPPGSVPRASKPTCETCDRAFSSGAELEEHIALHETCGREGCTFTAHPKVVAKHVEAQHDTGLYARMKKEEAQWIQARKKKYPTVANVTQKKLEKQERIERGERIGKPNGRFGSRGRGGWRKNNRMKPYTLQQPKETPPPQEQRTQSAPVQPVEPSTEYSKEEVEKTTVMPTTDNPLLSLLGEYCSGDSDSDDAPAEAPVSRELVGPPLPPPVPEAPKVVPVKKPPQPQRPVPQRNPREQFKRRNRPPTLLQKLLEPEIRRERNLLLQCVRYVVQNNFFKN